MIRDDKKISTSFKDHGIELDKVVEATDNIKEAAISREKIGGEPQMVISEIFDNILYSGFFGTLDTSRVQRITEKILDFLSRTEAEIVIVDLTNIEVIDSAVATHLIKFAETIFTIGCRVIFSGIRPVVAQTMAFQSISIRKLNIRKNLKFALKEALSQQGLKIVPKED